MTYDIGGNEFSNTPLKVAPQLNMMVAPPLSQWRCYLFGNKPGQFGMVWTPRVNEVPNWFWRKMQWLILGNLWVFEKDRNQ